MFKQRMEAVSADPVASALLPKARTITQMRSARKSELNRTVLGTLLDAVQNTLINNQSVSTKKQEPYIPETSLKDWLPFCEALLQGDMKQALEALNRLLIEAKMELLRHDLPPLPPSYYEFEANANPEPEDAN